MTYIYNSVTTVNNFPTTQNVVITGTLAGGANVVVTNFPAAQNVTILGNANATVTNWPATQNVYVINNPATENVYIVNTPFVNQAGTWWVNVNAFPATQNVYVLNDYSVNNVNIVNTPFVSQAGTWWVNVNAFPATQNVFVTNTPSDQNVTVIGTANVSVTNLPATQNVYVINEPSSLTLLGTANVLVTNTPANQNVTVTGTANVLVTNLPATQNVLVTNTPSIQNVFVTGTANVLVTNLTANQNVTVTGTANVLITNLPATQNVLVTNTPANQNVTVTGTANVLVTNIPVTQNVFVVNTHSVQVTGTANVLVTNLPSNQNVTVTNNANVTVTNFPNESNVNLNQVNGAAHTINNPVFTQTTSLYYPTSTMNSSNVQLNSGASFLGGIETILNLQAAQVEVVCDQPYTVNVYQYIDAAGTQLSSTDTFTRAAGQPLNENVTLPGNYFRLLVTNTGLAATLTFALNTTFGIMNTTPRTNTNLGNYKTSIEEVGGVATNGSVPVRGNVNATILGIANVLITNLPANQNVTVTGTANVLITNLPANQNVTVTGTANVLITNLPSVQNVQVVANNSLAPIYVQYASSVQQDALGRLKVSMVQDQTWYAPTVDKDGDLRWTELFTSNVVTTTASSTRTSNILTLASSTGIYAGAVVTDGSGVLYSPPTYVVSVIGSNVLLNQNATVTSGAVLTFNNNTRLATAAGDQNLTSNLVVSSTTGISPWDQVLNITPGTANVFPFNTFVVSVANATVLTLNQNVSVSNADTISFSTASSYFNENTSDISMTPGNTADGSAIRQTRITQRIIPGVSHTVYQSVNFNGNDYNTVKKFGLYNDHGGMYWQINGTADSLAAVVRRTQPDGTIYEDVVYRPNFNIDPLDGTGASKFNITTTQNVAITSWASTVVNPNFVGGQLVTYNVTANQGNTFALGSSVTVSGVTPATFNGTFSVSSYGTSNVTVAYPTNPGVFGSLSNGNLYQSQYHKYFTWWIEFIGGRTGRIRFGLGTTAGPTIAHTFNYSGVLSSTFVSTASLPVRYEINNVATVPYHPTMLIAGSTFNMEAGQSVNPGFGVSAFTTGWLADATLSPIIGIGLRAKAPFNSADMQLKSFTMLDTANRVVGGGGAGTLYGAYYWQLILNPLISGPIPVPVNSGKASRYWKYQPGANIVPNTGVLVDSGFFTSQIAQSNETITNFLNMGKDVQGYNPDQLVLCVQQLAAGANGGNIVASMNWVEFL